MTDPNSVSTRHPVDILFAELAAFGPYPEGVIPLPARIAGTAFFPGGAGLWGVQPGQPLPPFPLGGVMILGHDFDSLAAFRKSYDAGTEVETLANGAYRGGATWRNLLPLLHEAGIDPQECFFTNAYMGLRADDESMGQFPGASDADFVTRSKAFFLRQVDLQRPRVIITLGAWVPSLIAPLAPELSHWVGQRSLGAIDRAGPVVTGVRFGGAATPTTVVALTHPSLRGPNVRRRRCETETGQRAELAMLHTALASARLPTEHSPFANP